MNEGLILVDTSAWVDFLQNASSDLISLMERTLEQDQVAITPIVRLELLTGSRDRKQYQELKEVLQGIHMLPLVESVFEKAEKLRFELRITEGITIPVPDVLIAASALHFDCDLLHIDQHFDMIEKNREDFRTTQVR